MNLCQCGCGKQVRLAPQTAKQKGWIKDKPLKYLKHHRVHTFNKWIVDPVTGCWNWQASGKQGYGVWNRQSAHRELYERTVGPVGDDVVIDHLCRNTRCVNPDHMEAVSYAENARRGLGTKLTYEKVARIRKLRTAGMKYVSLAAMFGTTKQNICHIVKGRSWKTGNWLESQTA